MLNCRALCMVTANCVPALRQLRMRGLCHSFNALESLALAAPAPAYVCKSCDGFALARWLLRNECTDWFQSSRTD
jgi:hypothetical protein